jgi:hypothetical protein
VLAYDDLEWIDIRGDRRADLLAEIAKRALQLAARVSNGVRPAARDRPDHLDSRESARETAIVAMAPPVASQRARLHFSLDQFDERGRVEIARVLAQFTNSDPHAPELS